MVRILTQSMKIASIAVVTLLLAFGGMQVFSQVQDNAKPDNLGSRVVFTINKSDTIDDVSARLRKQDLITSELYFKTRVRIANGEPQPGSYKLTVGMSAADIADAITSEKSAAKTKNPDLKVVIIEGWRTEQIAAEVGKAGLNGGAKAFLAAVSEVDTSQFDFLKDRATKSGKSSLEGYLFPDTYVFKADTPPEDLIQLMLLNFDEKVSKSMRDRAKEMNLTLNEVLTIASIVEREAQVGAERPTVADVYLNRIEQGWRLDADPTVQYAIGNSKEWWPVPTGKDLEVDSPYNTYTFEGFPPGPICNPSLDSINAVLFPAGTNFMFFVAKLDGSGEHAFAETLDEHNINVAEYVKNSED